MSKIVTGVLGRSFLLSLVMAALFVVAALFVGCGGKRAVIVPAPEVPPQLMAEGTSLIIGQLYPVRLTLIERLEGNGRLVRTWYFAGSQNPRVPDALTPPARPHGVNDIPAGHMRVVRVTEGPLNNGNEVPWVQLTIELNPGRGLHPQKRIPLLKGYE